MRARGRVATWCVHGAAIRPGEQRITRRGTGGKRGEGGWRRGESAGACNRARRSFLISYYFLRSLPPPPLPLSRPSRIVGSTTPDKKLPWEWPVSSGKNDGAEVTVGLCSRAAERSREGDRSLPASPSRRARELDRRAISSPFRRVERSPLPPGIRRRARESEIVAPPIDLRRRSERFIFQFK